MAQEFRKAMARAVHPALHCADGTRANRRGLLIREPLRRDQEQRFPLFSAKTHEGGVKILNI